MELLESIAKIVHTNNPSDDKERYWRLLVKLFLVDRSEGLLLSSLPDYFKKYYDRQMPYNGKLSVLVQEPAFKVICCTTTIQSSIWIKPSDFLIHILRLQQNIADLKLQSTSNINNNNNNIKNKEGILNPFALDAIQELEGTERNSDTKFGRLTSEELTCGICFELLKNAVEGNCCKNLFCASCIEGYGRKCPNCRKVVTWTPNEPIRRLIAKKPVQCDYEDCGMWSTVSEIEQHRVKCEFNPTSLIVGCQKCQQRIMRNLMEEHLSNTCELNDVPCHACGLMIVRKDLVEHEAQLCDFRRVLCAHGCGQEIPYKQYTKHVNTCSHRLVKCRNKNCPSRVQKQLLQEHQQVCDYAIINCPNSEQGCKQHVLRGLTQQHLATCNFQLVQCECDAQIIKRNYKKHTCDYTPVKCPYCPELIKKKDLERHKDECPSRPVNCPNNCGAGVMQKDLQEHVRSSCLRRKVECSKCEESMVFASLAKHVTNHCPQRMVKCLCGTKLNASSLAHHEAKECTIRLSKCPKCTTLVCALEYEEHMTRLCGKLLVKCRLCRAQFLKEEQVTHIMEQCPERSEECPECCKFFRIANLPRHIKVCPERGVTCSYCKEIFAASYLQKHYQECEDRKMQALFALKG